MSRTLWGQGPGEEGKAVEPAQPPSDKDKVDGPAQNDAAPVAGAAPRPIHTTPASGGLAARLMQNRAKSGRHRVDGEPAPGGEQANSEASGTVATGSGPAPLERATTPPGGGVPVPYTRTQLGLGDSVRAALESARVPVPASLKPLRPLRPTPTGARSIDSPTAAASMTAGSAAGGVERPASPDTERAGAPADGRVALGDGQGVVGEPVLLAETTAVAPLASAATAAEVPEGGTLEVAARGTGSEPVTGPVAAIGSGPVFDPLSGPITNVSSAPVAAAVPRPGRHPTPASGRLAALLAESRKKTGRHRTLEGASAGGTPAPVTPPPSGPVAFTPVPVVTRSETSSPAVTSAAEDTTTVRVPGAAVAEKKVPAFAATLLGLPAPTVAADAASGAVAAWGPGRLRDSGLGAGTNRNAPVHVEGDATEPSNLAPGDLTASATGWRRRQTAERKRITDVVDVVRPPKHRGATAALIVSATMISAIVVVFVARGRRPSVPAGPTAVRPAATAVQSPTAGPPALPATSSERAAPAAEAAAVAGERAPVAGAPTGSPSRMEEPGAPSLPAAIAPARDGEEAKQEPAVTPPPAAAESGASAATVAADHAREERRRSTARDADGESKPKTSREGARRAVAADVTAAPKLRRASERRARTQGTTVAGTAFEPARPRVGQPSRMVPVDPDGTLPLAPQ